MPENILPRPKKSKRAGSERAIQNILETADMIIEDPSSDKPTARKLSEKSGYSIGALYHYFHKAEHAFILMLFKRREKRLANMIEIISQFPQDQPLKALLELLVDACLETLNSINGKMLVLVSRMFIKHSKNHWIIDNALTALAEPLIAARKRNLTSTFREIEHDELVMLLKICAVIIRRPFLEQDPIAGSNKHRDFAIRTISNLLGTSIK